ncbi:MAG TPA: ELM1/GtrOC1 family putative glycosyltransferase, partial [bacterium]|nr:ELM1/GtrOC1 family putative glycosyltransferase [bacterium]
GVARAVPGAELEVLSISFRGPTYRLPARKGNYPVAPKLLALFCWFQWWAAGRKLLMSMLKKPADWHTGKPACVLSAGSSLAPVNLILARSLGCCSVVIMTPSLVPLSLFDLAIIPYHDWLRHRVRRDNIVVTLGAPSNIDRKTLEEEKRTFGQQIGIFRYSEIVGVLLGGNDQNYRLSPGWLKKFLAGLQSYSRERRVGFVFTTSRRTPEDVVQYLKQELARWENVLYEEYPGKGVRQSHYPGILACSELLLVTEDSINMISESVSSGRKVVIVGVERKKKRLIFDRTIEQMCQKGYAHYIPESELERLGLYLTESLRCTFQTLNEAERCAQKILQVCQSRRFC